MPNEDAPSTRRFAFRFSAAYALVGLPFAVTTRTAWLTLSAQGLQVRFGLWRLSTPRANISGAEVTGPFSFLKTAGPAHLSFSDQGVTFATNGERGTCITFRNPVPALNPFGPPLHPNLTVTVSDPVLLADLLSNDVAR